MIRTLIVDDEKLVRKGLISVMPWKRYGFVIVGEAANGEKAIQFIKENDVDLAFIDLTMPVMSGLDLMKEIKAHFPEISMVVLTCHQHFDYIQEALRLGAVDYIVKTQLDKEEMNCVLERISSKIRGGRTIDAVSGEKYSDDIRACIMDAVEFLAENISDEISQDVVSKKVNMSRGYFSHCFKEVVGKSFSEYVRDMKIDKAKGLLLKTCNPIYMIAEQAGFQDEKYFSKFFKKHTGYLPTEYRAKNKYAK